MRTTILGVVGAVLVACSSEPKSTTPTPPADAATSTPVEEDAGAQCLSAGGNCRDDANACCNGFTCVFDVNDRSKAVCAQTCLNGTQCNTGCCTTLIEGTAKVCAPTKYCSTSCVQPGGGSCASAPCCENAVCVNSTVTGISCAARCATHSQCASGCCAALDNTKELVCSPASFCQ